MKFYFSLFIFYFVLFKSLFINCRPLENDNQILIVISYDGFRNEYFDINTTPNMLNFRDNGVYAKYMKSVFPTKTFPNHHSIATGLYPGTHGVTANGIYDPKYGRELKYSYELFHYNKDILPIYILNEKNGGTSGCMMWPGSDYEYSNTSCTYSISYNTSVPIKNRIDTIISWLKNTVKPPNLIMLYYEEPDKHSHYFGTDFKITEYVKKADSTTQYLQEQLKIHELIDRTNVIHLSDHGVMNVGSENFIDLTKFLMNGTFSIYGTSPVLQIVPTEGNEMDVYNRLKNSALDNGNFKVYKSDTLLKRWYCNENPRLGPILAVAEPGYAFQDMFKAIDYYNKRYNFSFDPKSKYGVHGYDNIIPEMYSMFMAKGPLFKTKSTIEPFDSIDLFGIFSKILNIKNPPTTNGTLSTVLGLLNDNDDIRKPSRLSGGSIFGIIVIVAVVNVVIFFGYRYYAKRRFYRL